MKNASLLGPAQLMNRSTTETSANPAGTAAFAVTQGTLATSASILTFVLQMNLSRPTEGWKLGQTGLMAGSLSKQTSLIAALILGNLAMFFCCPMGFAQNPTDAPAFTFTKYHDPNDPLFTFIHITDTHIVAGKPNTNILRAIADINLLQPQPKFAVITGDLIDGEQPEESVSLCKRIFSQLHCPWFPVFGNHDDRKEFGKQLQECRNCFPQLTASPAQQDVPSDLERGPENLNYSFDLPPYHMIVLDDIGTDAEDTYGGIFSEATITWLQKHLHTVSRESPVLLFCHASIYSKTPMSKCLPGDAHQYEPVLEMLKPYRVVAWFAGHAHTNYHVKKDDVDYFIAGSLSDNRSNNDGLPGYNVVTVYKDRVETSFRKIDQFVSPIVVAQDGSGDYNGNDEKPICRAIDKVSKNGGTIFIKAGEYAIRAPLVLKSNITISGTSQTVLKLPPPTRVTEAAREGATVIRLDDVSGMAADTTVNICSPVKEDVPSGAERSLAVKIAKVENGSICLANPLPHQIPEKSRIGYAHNVFYVGGSAKNVVIKNLVIDGGRAPNIPMPNHIERCAIFAGDNWTYENGPTAPPVDNIQVLNCKICNCYGRAAAFYAVMRAKVENCFIANIADEGIDFDHFCFYGEARNNYISGTETGITVNDGSFCVIEHNHLVDCGVGVTIWRYRKCPQNELDIGNVIRENFITKPHKAGISLGIQCFWNEVVGNFVEGGIHAAEPCNNNNIENNFVTETSK